MTLLAPRGAIARCGLGLAGPCLQLPLALDGEDAGDVTPPAVFALIEKYYGGWQRGYVAPQVPVEPEQTAERRVDVAYDGQSLPLVMIGYKLPVYDAADRTRVAADLFADLAFGETSEAYRRLVLDEQVVEDLDAGAAYNRDPGLLEIYARIKDPAKVEAYRKLAAPVMQASGGRFLVRGDPTKIYEAGAMQRVVVIEFESVEKAIAVHDSPGYQAALKALGDGAVRDLRIVPGVE